MAKTARAKRSPSGARARTRSRVRPTHIRPRTRGDCDHFGRPCPYVGCRYHLYLEVREKTGAIKLRFPGKEPADLEESCALDAAEEGGMTLSAIGQRMNLTRERIRQIERIALRKLAEVGLNLEEFLND